MVPCAVHVTEKNFQLYLKLQVIFLMISLLEVSNLKQSINIPWIKENINTIKKQGLI